MLYIMLCGSECCLARGPGVCANGESVTCAAKVKLQETLHKYFKFPTFWPGQIEALLPVLHGNDVFVRMATGAGKSLCIFLAPLAVSEPGIGVIISPLIAPTKPQV